MDNRKKYAAGNWKMNGTSAAMCELTQIADVAAGLGIITMIGLPATMIDRARGLGIAIAGQDCHTHQNGAHTGDISAKMLVDAGATHVILGHSERRTDHAETSELIAAKTRAAWVADLVAIVCIGESEEQYRAGITMDVLRAQINASLPDGATPENTVIAYEPIWAIGTGLTPTTDEIQSIHAAIRAELPDAMLSILYGGSVKPSNASDIFALEDVDGGLVGGASLKADDFIPIMKALEGTTK